MLFEVESCAVEAEIFQFAVSIVENRTGRIFINTATFHADKTIFADVDDTDAVTRANFVELRDQFNRAEFFTIDSDGDTGFKVDRNFFGLIGSIFGRDAD